MLDPQRSTSQIEPMTEDQNESAADEQINLVARILPVALPTGIVAIGGGAYLLPISLFGAIALLVLGVFLTWLGKRAIHHTLTQPRRCLFLLIGVVLLVINQMLGPSQALVQVLLTLILAGAILGPGKAGF